ncbi:MAG TPA: dephospho-CoA kinase [Candidatus Binatus sp.]|nr:dephospho-CoA kinase [Candidatus Binatus sp.]
MAARPIVGPIVGLTGGIGAGKSSVAALLSELGARVIDADQIGHEVYRPGTEGHRRVVETFGPGVVAPDGTIDRRALGAIVFADPSALARLNAAVHPLIAAEVERRIAGARADGFTGPIVVEAAILLEARWQPLVERVWVVSAARENAVARVAASRGLTRAEIERRIDAQMSDGARRRAAELVIENDGPPAALRAEVEKAWRTLFE